MNILVDICHSAHVHFFKYAIGEWKKHGHQVRIVTRDKGLTLPLLDECGYTYDCLSRVRKGIVGLAFEMVQHESRLLRSAREFQPDVMLSVGGTFVVHVGKLLGIRTITFSDTEVAVVANRITYPFTDVICTPSCYKDDWGKKHIRYEGYQELAYTHPNWFTPNPRVLDELGLKQGEKLFTVRFVAWQSGHDVMQRGFSLEGKRRLVKSLGEQGRVIITAEDKLPPDLEPYRMQILPTKMHDLLAFSTLYIGESATMASESALLGTPFIFVSPMGRGYTDEQEKKYRLGYTIGPDQEGRAIELALELAQRENLHEEWHAKRQRLLQDKIDVTAWLVDFVEQYAQSSHQLREKWSVSYYLYRRVGRLIPRKCLLVIIQVYFRLLSLIYRGNTVICPCCGGHFRKFLPRGGRPNAMCPGCAASERQRLLWLYLKNRTNLFSDNLKVLHFAPEYILQKIFSSLPNLDYTSADLDSPLAMVKMDITNILYEDNFFDVILCSHVLEHVPDDQQAMRELFRVLKPGGWAILQVPVEPERDKTFEAPDIVSSKDRERLFGHCNHVRTYGSDYKDRLEQAGFTIKMDTYFRNLDTDTIKKCCLIGEDIYFCSKSESKS